MTKSQLFRHRVCVCQYLSPRVEPDVEKMLDIIVFVLVGGLCNAVVIEHELAWLMVIHAIFFCSKDQVGRVFV